MKSYDPSRVARLIDTRNRLAAAIAGCKASRDLPAPSREYRLVLARLVAACLAGAYRERDGGYSLWCAAAEEIDVFGLHDVMDCVLEVLAQHIADTLYNAHGYEQASDMVAANIAGALDRAMEDR